MAHIFFAFFFCHFFVGVITLFKMSPKCAEELSSVPEHRKAVMCFVDKIGVLDKLPSGMTYSCWLWVQW